MNQQTLFSPQTDLQRAKSHFQIALTNAERQSRIECPVCDRIAIVYWKAIHSSSAAALVRLVRMYQGLGIHIDDFNIEQGGNSSYCNFASLKLWNLVKPQENILTRKSASGIWHPTQHGIDFVNERITVPKTAVTFNKEIIRFEGEQVGIREALGNRFDYGRLMGWYV